MSLERAREHIEGIEDLPTLPEVVIEITRLVENPDTTAEAIYKIVSADVSLSATMLKLVNSAFYGMSKNVTSLEKAIKILGFATVRNVALAAFVFDAFLKGKGRFDYRGFWLHSIGTGAGSSVLAKRMKIKEAGDYFVYGLLHDLGIVIFMQYLSEELGKVKRMVDEGTDLGKAETEAAGCTHNELGAALGERWDFPPALISVIANHCGDVPPAEFKREVAAVTCASTIAQALEVGIALGPRVKAVSRECWEAAQVAPDQMGQIIDEVFAELEHYRTFIDLLYR
jgi:HD-like signal output (HDOD) protein